MAPPRPLLAVLALLPACATPRSAAPGPSAPVVIAHRGASGDLPEHTLAAYLLAILQGADLVEPDLVLTADGVLVARHERTLARVELDGAGNIVLRDGEPVVLHATTDVASRPHLRPRLTVKRIGERAVGGWFVEDLTLEELRAVRAIEPLPELRPASAREDGLHGVPTFAEVLALVRFARERTGREVGVFPELKVTDAAEGPDAARLLVRDLLDAGVGSGDPVWIQCFELEPLLRLERELLPEAGLDLPLVLLLGEEAARDPGLDLEALAAAGIDGIGPARTALLPREELAEPLDADGDGRALVREQRAGAPTDLVRRAHAAGLSVHAWTVRAEEPFRALLPSGRVQDLAQEVRELLELGVDGVFTDQPGPAVAARDAFLGADEAAPGPSCGAQRARLAELLAAWRERGEAQR